MRPGWRWPSGARGPPLTAAPAGGCDPSVLFLPQIGLIDLLSCMGLRPDGIIGHSLGEVACGYADGCLSQEEAVLAAYWRGQCIKEAHLPPGAMAAVGRCPRGLPEGPPAPPKKEAAFLLWGSHLQPWPGPCRIEWPLLARGHPAQTQPCTSPCVAAPLAPHLAALGLGTCPWASGLRGAPWDTAPA